tara:strand:- start:1660 stop:2502 length:843 start_codon:yes stop_codon:yes gene_type:complete
VLDYKTQLSYLDSELGVGETTRDAQCPFCLKQNGDFAVTKVENGLLYKCFRVACDSKGFIPSNLGEWNNRKFTPVSSIVRESEEYPFESHIINLSEEQILYLRNKFNLTNEEIILNKIKWCNRTERVIYPILSQDGDTKGYVSRYYKELSNKKYDGVKSRTYWINRNNNYYNVSFPYRNNYDVGGIFVLVEDIISSIRVARHVQCVALLSNSIPTNAMRFFSGKNIVIVLDNDATVHALKIKQRYSLFFNSCQVISIDKDPKNMGNEELINKIITPIKIN